MTSEYQDADSMWAAALGDVLRYGRQAESRNGGSTEVIGWSGKLLDPQRNFVVNSERRLCASYAAAEVLWYLSRSDDVEMIKAYAKSYAKYAEPPDYHRAYGAYGARVAGNVPGVDQLELAAEQLWKRDYSRQVVVTLWRPNDLAAEGVRDKPCTVCLQYNLRGNELYAGTYMRSNDAWLGMPYDVFAFTCIQALLAGELGVGLGSYSHHVGSLHLYDGDSLRGRRAWLEVSRYGANTPAHGWPLCEKLSMVPTAVQNEAEFRLGGRDKKELWHSSSTMLSDLTLCCAAKHGYKVNVSSPALKKGLK